MRRPGFLSGFSGFTPKTSSNNLGEFGKGVAKPKPKVHEPDPADLARQEAEIKRLEAQAASMAMAKAAAILAPPSAYTGGGMPTGLPARARSHAPSRSEQVEDIVSEFETRRAMSRAGGRSSAPIPELAPIPATPPPPPPPAEGGGILSWLRGTLFGSYDDYVLSGLGEQEHFDNTKLIITIVVVMGILKLMQKRI